MYKTATVFGQEYGSRTLLKLLGSSFIRPLFENIFPVLCATLRVFISALVLNSSIHFPSNILKLDAILTEKLLYSIRCC